MDVVQVGKVMKRCQKVGRSKTWKDQGNVLILKVEFVDIDDKEIPTKGKLEDAVVKQLMLCAKETGELRQYSRGINLQGFKPMAWMPQDGGFNLFKFKDIEDGVKADKLRV